MLVLVPSGSTRSERAVPDCTETPGRRGLGVCTCKPHPDNRGIRLGGGGSMGRVLAGQVEFFFFLSVFSVAAWRRCILHSRV
jgi:hypothetical protein